MSQSVERSTVPGRERVPALRLAGVGVRFGGITALNDISMNVAPGERWAVIGPNGAGKTTLFRVISGERYPTSGHVELFGRHCTRWSQLRRVRSGLGRTFQINNVFSDLTVEQNLAASAQVFGRKQFNFWRQVRIEGSLKERIDVALERTGLWPRRQDLASELSHGEARQLELALALARDSKILLLDEPAAGLASRERRLIKDMIEQLPQSMTIVLIEHDMDLALDLVDRVMCLNNGSMVISGTPQEIRASDEVQRVYLGSEC